MNYRDILDLCQHCARAYETKTIIGTSTDTEVLINEQPDKIIIAFTGSESITDWRQNIDFKLEPFPLAGNAKVHSGFLECFLSVKHQIFKLIKDDPRPIFLTGHSLGGAIATLAALSIKIFHYNTNLTCVTFGSPKPGNKCFAQLYSDLEIPTYRIVNSSDIVPSLPRWWQGDYHHVCPAYPIGVINKFSVFGLRSKIKNHYVNEYVMALSKINQPLLAL